MHQRSQLRRQVMLSGLIFGIIALLFGVWSYHHQQHYIKRSPLKSGTELPIPREIMPFQLASTPTGNKFTNAELKGHWSMLFFGFTHCAMLCPSTLSTLNQFYQHLEADKVGPLPQIVFISIDPERDSLKRINDYVTSFNKHFQGATGSEQQLESLTKELSILYQKIYPNNHEDDYQIDHSGTVLVINPEGHLIALFSPPLEAKVLAEDYERLTKQ